MDLKKFKLISAVFLAGALLFLSVILMVNKNQADNLPYSVAEDLSALFAGRDVELSPDIIPLKRDKLPVYSCSTADGTQAQIIAETIGNSTRFAANLTEDGYLFRLASGAMIEVSRLREVKFDHNKINTGLALSSPPTDSAKMMADAFIARFTASLDGDDEKLCTYTLKGYASQGSDTLLNFEISIDGIMIEGSGLSVRRNESGDLLGAYGNCVFVPLKKESGFKNYDIINILKREYDEISESGSPSSKINSISSCYLIHSSADGKQILFLPAWKIVYSNGIVRFYESVLTETY